MTEGPGTGNVGTEDYEYDLAHEATAAPAAVPPASAPQPPPGMHSDDDGGDYGYDAAHDLA